MCWRNVFKIGQYYFGEDMDKSLWLTFLCNHLQLMAVLYVQAHVRSVLNTLPQFVGSSYDANAWRSCLTSLIQRLIAAFS